MSKYRRIEVNAYRRRVTVVSGVWPREDISEAPRGETDEGISLNDGDVCEPVEPDSPEGQLMLVDAVRSLERRLLPDARAAICTERNALIPNDLNPNVFFLKLRSIFGFIRNPLRFIRKEERNNAAKQSVKD